MKTILLPLLCCCLCAQLRAQPPVPDTLISGGGTWPSPWHAAAATVPVLLNPAQAKSFAPQEKLCFDKKILIKTTGTSRPAETWMYLNTEDGYVGLITYRAGESGTGDIKPNEPKFRFTVIGRKGNVYNYSNRKKRDQLEHLVMTGNTENSPYQFTPGSDALFRKTGRNMYCGDKFKTWAYKSEGAAPTLHLFGRRFPNKLVGKDFFGYAGVGYLHTDEGIYIACEMEKDGVSFEMRSFETVNVCFDPAAFRKMEENALQEMEQGLETEKAKLDAKTFSGDCSGEKTALNNFKKQMVDKKKRNLQTAKSGNVYQNRNVQQAYANMMDPIDMAQEGIYDTEVKICKAQTDMNKAAAKGQSATAERYARKLTCYQDRKGRLQAAIGEMRNLDSLYRNEPGKAYVEKMKIMGRLMEECP